MQSGGSPLPESLKRPQPGLSECTKAPRFFLPAPFLASSGLGKVGLLLQFLNFQAHMHSSPGRRMLPSWQTQLGLALSCLLVLSSKVTIYPEEPSRTPHTWSNGYRDREKGIPVGSGQTCLVLLRTNPCRPTVPGEERTSSWELTLLHSRGEKPAFIHHAQPKGGPDTTA